MNPHLRATGRAAVAAIGGAVCPTRGCTRLSFQAGLDGIEALIPYRLAARRSFSCPIADHSVLLSHAFFSSIWRRGRISYYVATID